MSLNAQAIAISGYGYGARLIAASGYGDTVASRTELTGKFRRRGKLRIYREEVGDFSELGKLLGKEHAEKVLEDVASKAKEQVLRNTQIQEARNLAGQALVGELKAREVLVQIQELEAKIGYTESKALKKKLERLAEKQEEDEIMMLIALSLDD